MGVVISLCDYTTNFVRPWAEAGYECYCVDLQHEESLTTKLVGKGLIHRVKADIHDWWPPRVDIAFVAAFPPCTDVAISGARWFKDKGLGGLISALQLFDRCVALAEWAGAPYFIENPVSTVSTYWRKPDHTFHPWHYAALAPEDCYTKKTHLWTGNGFVMPEPRPLEGVKPDDRIHKAAPSPERANFRSATPRGFSLAVFQSNATRSPEE